MRLCVLSRTSGWGVEGDIHVIYTTPDYIQRKNYSIRPSITFYACSVLAEAQIPGFAFPLWYCHCSESESESESKSRPAVYCVFVCGEEKKGRDERGKDGRMESTRATTKNCHRGWSPRGIYKSRECVPCT